MPKLLVVEPVTSAVEDYAKAIYALETRADTAVSNNALAERLGVTAASASSMVKKLAALGLVRHEPYRGVRLTPAGEAFASECRLALVSSAGFVLPGQKPFDESIRGGDYSFREIPGDAEVQELHESHRSESFDHTGIHEDPNLAFPLDRARELVLRGRIGSLSRRHLSFMGSITAPGRLIQQTAPASAQLLVEDAADVALLVPV